MFGANYSNITLIELWSDHFFDTGGGTVRGWMPGEQCFDVAAWRLLRWGG